MPPLNLPMGATPPLVPQPQAGGGGFPQGILEQMRLSGIFNPQQQPSTAPMGAPPMAGGMPPGGIMGGYEPETGAADRLSEMLGNYPEREKRGMIEKIALSMMALNDPRLVANIMQQPSQEQMDWEAQIGPAETAAQQERLTNVNMRQIIDMIESNRLAQERVSQAGERIEETGRSNLESERLRELGITETGERQQKGFEAATELEGVRQTGRKVLETQRETGRKGRATTAVEEKKTAATLQEKRLRSRPSKPGVLTESARATGRVNRAQKLINEHPDWADWITIDGRNVTVAPAAEKKSRFGRDYLAFDVKGPSPEVRKQIMDTLYPNGEPKETGVMEKPIPDGSGIAISRDGGKTWQRK